MKSDMELLYQKNKNSKNKIFHEDDDFEDEVNHSKNNRIVNKMDNILKIMTIQS